MKEHFTLVLAAVFIFTVLCGAASAVLAIKYGPELTGPLADVQKSLWSLFTAGAGAIIGMLGTGALK